MKRLMFTTCLLTVLLTACSNADLELEKTTPFRTIVDEGFTQDGFTREIRYPRSQYDEYSGEFIVVFDYDFFTQEREANSSKTDVLEYIRQGIKAFQVSAAGSYKFKKEHQQKLNESASVVYVEPLHLRNTSFVVSTTVNDSSSPLDIHLYDVKLYGLVGVNASEMSTYTIDAEYLALFHITGKIRTDVINLCGLHTLKNDHTSLIGSFCYEIVNVTYRVDYAKMRTIAGNVLTVDLKEDVTFQTRNYTDVTFSTDMNKWLELQQSHSIALTDALTNYYLLDVGQRVRIVFESDPTYIDAQSHFVRMYEGRVLSTLADLVRLYLKKVNNTHSLIVDADKSALILQNFGRYLYAYTEHDEIEALMYINVTAYYSENDSDTLIMLASRRYVVQQVTIVLTVRLVNEVDLDSLSNLQVSVTSVNLSVNASTPIDTASKDYVTSAIKNIVSNFIPEVLSDECKADEVKKH